MKKYSPDNNGFYGEFGGAYIPEMLMPNITELKKSYLEIINQESFQTELNQLLTNYVGRPSPLYFSAKLSERYKAKIYFKREDLNHTGAHKINNALGQVLLAKRMNKTRIIAETGAGQHGVATATACALLNMKCTIFMGLNDTIRQQHNVERMKMLGAEVVAVTSGSQTLKDATNEALRDWIRNTLNTHYIIGSVVGPHPYPDIVTKFQAIISKEIAYQLNYMTGRSYPDTIIACVGGGSNAMGAFYHFIENPNTDLIAIEAAGLGISTTRTAAAMTLGDIGVLHGCKTMIMQDAYGQIKKPHSISAGLDYPGVGPSLAHLYRSKRIKVTSVTDIEALNAGIEFTEIEGIIPALESAHAIAYIKKHKIKKGEVVVVCLSGRGDKDLETYLKYLNDEK